MNRFAIRTAINSAESLEGDFDQIKNALRQLEVPTKSKAEDAKALASALETVNRELSRSSRPRYQWTVVLPVAFMWFAIGFAVEGFVNSGTDDSFLAYWSEGAPPFGINSFRNVALIEGSLLLLVGTLIGSSLGRPNESTNATLQTVSDLLSLAQQEIAVGTGSSSVGSSASHVAGLGEDELRRLENVLDVWGEMEPAVAEFVDTLRSTPAELRTQVEGLVQVVRDLEAPVKSVVSAVAEAQGSVADIAEATESTVRSLVTVGEQGAVALDEATTSLLATTRSLNREMEPLIETMMVLRNLEARRG